MKKWALITGASGGIGSKISERLANLGYHLIMHYHSADERIFNLQKKLMDTYNNEIICLKADLSTKEGASSLLSGIYNPIDCIVHNSGLSYYGLFTEMLDEDIQKMIQVNFTSPITITKHLLPGMIARKSGRIIIISSIWGHSGASCEVVYSAVKGGLNTFVKALAKEVAPSGIYVNGIAPGAVDTNMLSLFTEEEKSLIKEEIPMNRLGRPEEIADIVSFLCTKQSSYVNGHIITASGGWHS
ncbi:SDR family NAD(P)-dependent oxidoreductase [Fictibacillus sp. Mic-4]|uniref:elongation factor P 5-aminopentanone reductase n=1 Tax=Fictibacillus TaxID=1329200 RepID=UPI000478685A|nr:SDR family NAD(P)-dependent oxidoreductase [Fictibacillus gelatini]